MLIDREHSLYFCQYFAIKQFGLKSNDMTVFLAMFLLSPSKKLFNSSIFVEIAVIYGFYSLGCWKQVLGHVLGVVILRDICFVTQ